MSKLSRRDFLRRAVLAGTALPIATNVLRSAPDTAAPLPPSERLNIGIIGPRGRGAANASGVATENIVALCDIDSRRLAEAKKIYSKAATFTDFRKLLDVKNLDAVVVATPDHMHAIPSVSAMRAGLDVYCEKPLAHSVHEIRVMRETAKKHRRVTQMGTQIHAGDNYRRAVEIVRSGALGDIRRVHVWMDGQPSLRDVFGFKTKEKGPLLAHRVSKGAPPPWVDYDLWIGPAPMRPFHMSSFHFNWRYWWDFGNGVLGDFGCHFMDLPHWALDLRGPLTVEAKGQVTHEGDNQVPDSMQVDYHYPSRGKLPPVHLTWYHGGWRPKGSEVYGRGSAVLFEGTHGRLVSDYGTHKIYADENVQDAAKKIEPIPKSIGHHQEWIHAVKTRGETTCNFDYSGALAETVLLGNVSYRTGKKLEWNDRDLRAENCPDAAKFIQREYRKGWSL